MLLGRQHSNPAEAQTNDRFLRKITDCIHPNIGLSLATFTPTVQYRTAVKGHLSSLWVHVNNKTNGL